MLRRVDKAELAIIAIASIAEVARVYPNGDGLTHLSAIIYLPLFICYYLSAIIYRAARRVIFHLDSDNLARSGKHDFHAPLNSLVV